MNTQTLESQSPAKAGSATTSRILILLACWFASVVALTLSGLFDRPAGQPPIPTLIAIAFPVMAHLTLVKGWAKYAQWIDGIDERVLILLHTGRFVGFGFVFLMYVGHLPAAFALPAGLGDVAAAAGALWLGIALYEQRQVSRRTRLAWNVFGTLDFVIAVTMGVISRLGSAVQASMLADTIPMGQFPLALIPGFAVPFYLITHLILFRRWLR